MTVLAKFCTRKKFLYHKTAKLNPCQVWKSLLSNIWSKYGIDICISHISINSNKIRASAIYLITITLFNNRKINIQSNFCFLFLLKLRNWIPVKYFETTNSWKTSNPSLFLCHGVNIKKDNYLQWQRSVNGYNSQYGEYKYVYR